MKKTIDISRLVLKRETLRMLDSMQLGGIRGGGDAAALNDSGVGTGCPANALETGAVCTGAVLKPLGG